MRRFDALIFDMDGVLVDSEPLHMQATQSVLRAEGVELPWAVYIDYVGATVDAMWADLIARYKLKGDYSDYLRRDDEAILEVLSREMQPEPGVRELITTAKANGQRLALASSSTRIWIEATLAGLSLGDTFEVIVAGEDVPDGKPAPDIYVEAARRLGLEPESCIAIEDSPKGVVSANAAGTYVVALRKPYNNDDRLAAADVILNSLTEFDMELLRSEGAA